MIQHRVWRKLHILIKAQGESFSEFQAIWGTLMLEQLQSDKRWVRLQKLREIEAKESSYVALPQRDKQAKRVGST